MPTPLCTTRIFTLAPSALGGIISVRDVAESGPNTDTWYHYDRLGNVMLTTDSDGASNGLRWQDAYGNQLDDETTGSWATASAANGYGLTTKEYDGDIDLYYFWQRWYDPTLGRFISRDLIWHPNMYEFLSNNPINRMDPTGLDDCPCDIDNLLEIYDLKRLACEAIADQVVDFARIENDFLAGGGGIEITALSYYKGLPITVSLIMVDIVAVSHAIIEIVLQMLWNNAYERCTNDAARELLLELRRCARAGGAPEEYFDWMDEILGSL